MAEPVEIPLRGGLTQGTTGLRSPREGAILGVVQPTLGVSAAVYAAKGIVQASITARHATRPFV